MANVKQGVLVWKDSKQNKARMFFEGSGITFDKMKTLSTALLAYTDAVKEKAIFKDVQQYVSATPATGHEDTKAVITAIDNEGKIHKWRLPSWNGTTVKTKSGYRVDETELAAIVADIATATGLTLTPLESPVIQTS